MTCRLGEGHGTDLDIRAPQRDRTVAHKAVSLGRVGIKKLTPAHVRGLYSEKLDSGLLAPATVHKIHSTLHKALSEAVSDGIVPRNAADVKAPRSPPPMRSARSQRARPERSWSRQAVRRALRGPLRAGDHHRLEAWRAPTALCSGIGPRTDRLPCAALADVAVPFSSFRA